MAPTTNVQTLTKTRTDDGPFYVMCRVSGGVTGTRQALLKENGTTQTFQSREAAEAKAAELNQRNNNRYSIADFRYWAVDAAEAWF